MSDIKHWKTLQSETVIDNPYMKVRKEVCQLPDGMIIQDYYVQDSPDAVVILCVTKEGQAVLVKQYRHALGEITLELPAGLVSRHDINPVEAARRELTEETGFAADKLHKMGEIFANPTRTKAKIHLFYAPGSEKIAMPLNTGAEHTETELVPVEDLPKLIEDGAINSLTQIMAIQYILPKMNDDRA